jgi:hypothetical protein
MKNKILLLFLSLTLSCCKDKNSCSPKTEKSYLVKIYNFQVVDAGSGIGFCGPLIESKDSGDINISIYKAVNLPKDISFSSDAKYKGVFEVLPEIYKCMDGRPDPLPGNPSPTVYPHFVNIIEWQKK